MAQENKGESDLVRVGRQWLNDRDNADQSSRRANISMDASKLGALLREYQKTMTVPKTYRAKGEDGESREVKYQEIQFICFGDPGSLVWDVAVRLVPYVRDQQQPGGRAPQQTSQPHQQKPQRSAKPAPRVEPSVIDDGLAEDDLNSPDFDPWR